MTFKSLIYYTNCRECVCPWSPLRLTHGRHSISVSRCRYDEAGAPIGGATLRLAPADEVATRAHDTEDAVFGLPRSWDGFPGSDTTDDDGRFEVRGLTAGEYVVEVIRAGDSHSEVLPAPGDRPFPRIKIASPEQHFSGVVVHAVSAREHIRGEVRLQDRAAPNVDVVVNTRIGYRDQHEQFVKTTTDAHGRFDLGGLHVGEYEVQAASFAMHALTTVRAQAGRSDVMIDLRPVARIRQSGMQPTGAATVVGSVHDRQGKPLAGIRCGAYGWVAAISGFDGRFTLSLPAGIALVLDCTDPTSGFSDGTTLLLQPNEVRSVKKTIPRSQ